MAEIRQAAQAACKCKEFTHVVHMATRLDPQGRLGPDGLGEEAGGPADGGEYEVESVIGEREGESGPAGIQSQVVGVAGREEHLGASHRHEGLRAAHSGLEDARSCDWGNGGGGDVAKGGGKGGEGGDRGETVCGGARLLDQAGAGSAGQG